MLRNKVSLFAIISRSLVDYCDVTNPANSHTPEAEKHTRKKHYTTLVPCCESEAILLKKRFVPATECLYYKSFIAVAEISVVETRSLYPGKQKKKKGSEAR